MREVFVYYRVRAEDAAAHAEAVAHMHDDLRSEWPGLRARLLRRPDAQDGQHTWMETYASEDGVTPELQAAIDARAQAVLSLIVGARHTEVFDACAS